LNGVKMEIKRVVPRPYEKCILPAMSFEVDIAHVKFQEAILGLEGFLESADGRILANIVEIKPEIATTSELGARDSSFDSRFKETVYNSTLVAILDRKALDYIEDRRMEDEKHDVYLTLVLNIRGVSARAKLSHFHEIDHSSMGLPPYVNVFSTSGKRKEGKILAYGHDSQFSTEFTNLWILSGDGSPVFLGVNSQSIKKEDIRISSTDWIHDFAPKLGFGEYFIVEIPRGKEAVKKAWDYVEKAEECSREGNTKEVYANCREVGYLLTKVTKEKFENKPAIKKWKRAIDKFETLTSMDLHTENITEQMPKGEISIGRPETEHVLIVTKALIKYAEELLREKN